MRLLSFAKRNTYEIIRDPLNLCFGMGFPLVIIFLLTAIQTNVPAELFVLEKLTPGVSVFGLSFMTLFSATLLSRDRETSFLQRLFTTPMTASDFIFGYALPILPMAAVQCLICYLVSAMLGLSLGVGIIYALLFILPISLFYISLGLIFGSILSVKQVGGICGALLTNLSAWLSGIWFDIELVGGAFEKTAEVLPFIHAVELERAAFGGNFADALPHLMWVLGYTAVFTALSVFVFLRRMKRR